MIHHSDYQPTPEEVLALHAETNMPLMKCKRALVIGNGNKKLANEWMRWHGLAVYRRSNLTNEELMKLARDNGYNPNNVDRNDLVWMADERRK